MMKKLNAVFSLLLVSIFIITGCGSTKNKLPASVSINTTNTSAQGSAAKKAKINQYNLNVELDPQRKTLSGKEDITYVNTENTILNEVYFHIYPNAYKKKETAPVLEEDYSKVYPDGFKPGYIDITDISINDSSASYRIEGADQTVLRVSLKKPLVPGENVRISIAFKIALPPAGDRLGYVSSCFNFGNWYPVAAVYDSSGWNLAPYYAMGDPFYSDVSDYNVKITVPKSYVVAATGENKAERVEKDKRIYDFTEGSVRDFAWVASDKFKFNTANVDGIEIKSYVLGEDSERDALALEAAKNSIEIFNQAYGKYPYKDFSVVATNFITGMEYPGLVYINKDYYNKDSDPFYLEVTIAHEAAHQWWYGAVGNNEVNEAWIDESLASYSEVVYYENIFGKSQGEQYFDSDYSSVFDNYKNRIQKGEIILQPVSRFKNNDDYALLVYYKGAIMLNTLRNDVGDKEFFDILRTFYKDYEFKNATTKDFIDVANQVTGKDLNQFFDKWLMK